jgi:LPXTG-motif cell wall-anchored protein
MIESIIQFFRDLSSLISVTNPVGLGIVFGLVVLADIGFIIPFVIEPALFLIVYQAGPFSVPVMLFVLMMTAGRQVGTGTLYWLSRLSWDEIERLLRRFFPGFAARFSRRVEQFERRLGKRQSIALAIARLTPGLLQVSTIASGILRIQFAYVLVGTFIAGIIYDAILVFLGGLAHYGLKGVEQSYSVFIALGIAVLMGLISFIIGRFRREKV